MYHTIIIPDAFFASGTRKNLFFLKQSFKLLRLAGKHRKRALNGLRSAHVHAGAFEQRDRIGRAAAAQKRQVGVALGFASSFQQFGIKYTSAGKAGFLTALYVIMIPLIGIFIRKKSFFANFAFILFI